MGLAATRTAAKGVVGFGVATSDAVFCKPKQQDGRKTTAGDKAANHNREKSLCRLMRAVFVLNVCSTSEELEFLSHFVLASVPQGPPIQ